MRTPTTTIQDIARALHTTPSTVSCALNNHDSISEATKQAVTRTAKKLNYRHNKIASALRLRRTKILGVVIPNAEINFFGSMVHGIDKVARLKEYNILIFQSSEQSDFEQEGVETFLQSRVDGVLVSISRQTTDVLHLLKTKIRRVPLVLFDRANESLGVPAVVVDDYAGAYKVTQHPVQQGCRHVSHSIGPQHVPIFQQRLRGYTDALRDAGAYCSAKMIVEGAISVESGKVCMRQLLAFPSPPDGVFAVKDFTALGAMQAIKEKGLKIPDDMPSSALPTKPLALLSRLHFLRLTCKRPAWERRPRSCSLRMWKQNDFYKTVPRKKVLEPVLVFPQSSMRKDFKSVNPVQNFSDSRQKNQ